MTALEVLKAARELLSNEKRWAKSALAIGPDPDGEAPFAETNATDPEAYCFCAMGAILRVAGDDDERHGAGVPALSALADALDRRYVSRFTDEDGGYEYTLSPANAISDFNDDDDTKHADVLAAFSRAIASLEAP